MSKLLDSTQIQLEEFRKRFPQGICSNLGDQLMYIVGNYKDAVNTLNLAKKLISDDDMPLVAIGNTLGFHYHAIYIKSTLNQAPVI